MQFITQNRPHHSPVCCSHRKVSMPAHRYRDVTYKYTESRRTCLRSDNRLLSSASANKAREEKAVCLAVDTCATNVPMATLESDTRRR